MIMAQPIRKKILEENPHLMDSAPFYTLLVDGTNLLRICFADTKVNTNGMHYGGVFQFLLQLSLMLKKHHYDYVYVFFDDENSGVLRHRYYKGYKANRNKNYDDDGTELSDYAKAVEEKLKSWRSKQRGSSVMSESERLVKENFARERDLLLKYFNELYIRWIFDPDTEGDDIIAYYVQHKKPEERIVIMSTDEDITQLISDTVCVYNKKMDKYLSTKNFQRLKGYPIENVVIKKIMCGDTSDNIKNISGLSEARLFELMPEMKERPVTINEIKERAKEQIEERLKEKKKPLKWQENIVKGVSNGEYDGDFYEINRKIIDLSEPMLTDSCREEISNMMYNVQDPEGRSFSNLYQYIVNDDITELRNEKRFDGFFAPFNDLAEREIKKFKAHRN